MLAKAQLDTLKYASIMQPVYPGMSRYWDPAASMGNEILDGKVTAANAMEKTETMNAAMNTGMV